MWPGGDVVGGEVVEAVRWAEGHCTGRGRERWRWLGMRAGWHRKSLGSEPRCGQPRERFT